MVCFEVDFLGEPPAGGFLLATAGIMDDLWWYVVRIATTDVCQRKSEVDEKGTG